MRAFVPSATLIHDMRAATHHSRQRRMRGGRRILAAAVALGASASACSAGGGEEAADTTPATAPVSATTVAPTSTAAPTTGSGLITTPPSSVTSTMPAFPTAPTVSITAPDITLQQPVEITPSTDLVPATTEPVAVQELVLSGDGIGSALFGAEPEGVISYVTSILGGNTADTGWVDPFSFAACEGNRARRVEWGALALYFSDQSPFASGRRHFIAWSYGREGEIGADPVGLRTAGGLTVGARVVDLKAEFPEVSVNASEAGAGSIANFYVSNVFWGLVTGDDDADYVLALIGGYDCAE